MLGKGSPTINISHRYHISAVEFFEIKKLINFCPVQVNEGMRFMKETNPCKAL